MTSKGIIPGKQHLQINTINSTRTGNIEMIFVLAVNQVTDRTRNLEDNLQKSAGVMAFASDNRRGCHVVYCLIYLPLSFSLLY